MTIFSLAQQFVGMEKLMMDMALGAEYVEPLFKACTDFQIEVGHRLDRAGRGPQPRLVTLRACLAMPTICAYARSGPRLPTSLAAKKTSGS